MIPEWSHIYEGPWYLSKVDTYGQPSEIDMGRAKKAQGEARMGLDVDVDVKEELVKKEPVKKERKKKEKPVIVETAPVPAVTPVTVPVPVPVPVTVTGVKPVTKRRYTKKQPSVPVIIEKPKVQIQAVEAASMLEDLDIIKIVVRPFSHNNTSYFLNTTKNKLYSVGKDKRPAAYVGRWNSESETIDTDFPDSDAE
jgi:hypothetical protein